MTRNCLAYSEHESTLCLHLDTVCFLTVHGEAGQERIIFSMRHVGNTPAQTAMLDDIAAFYANHTSTIHVMGTIILVQLLVNLAMWRIRQRDGKRRACRGPRTVPAGKSVNVVLVGCSQDAQVRADAYRRERGVRVYGVCDSDAEVAEGLKTCGAGVSKARTSAAFHDFRAVLADAEVHAVDVSGAPSALREWLVTEAAVAGVHVTTPEGDDRWAAARMARQAAAAGIAYRVGEGGALSAWLAEIAQITSAVQAAQEATEARQQARRRRRDRSAHAS